MRLQFNSLPNVYQVVIKTMAICHSKDCCHLPLYPHSKASLILPGLVGMAQPGVSMRLRRQRMATYESVLRSGSIALTGFDSLYIRSVQAVRCCHPSMYVPLLRIWMMAFGLRCAAPRLFILTRMNAPSPTAREEGVPTGALDKIFSLPDGSVWLAGSSKLLHFEGDRWIDFGKDHGHRPIWSVLCFVCQRRKHLGLSRQEAIHAAQSERPT